MAEMESMNLFGSVEHTDDNDDIVLPACVPDASDNNAMLDYLALTTIRNLQDNSALKGGYLLNQLIGIESRMTHEIDFSIMNEEYYSVVKAMLSKIADKFVEMGIIATYKLKETITATSSGGIDMYDDKGRKVLGVDVGLHNILYGTTKFQLRVGEANSFKVERMLSDKLLAILSRKRFRRTKDLYDFYILTNHFDFSYEELLYCIEHRDNYDATVWDNIPFSEVVLLEYEKAWEKLELVSFESGVAINKPNFNEVILRFNSIAFRIKENITATSWNHDNLCWR
jgi:hypothetical protein